MKFAEKIDRREWLKLAGYLGFGLLIVGYLRYSIQEVLDTINKVILITGAALFVGGVVLNFREVLAFFRTRSARLGANTAIMTVAVVAILAVGNFLGYKHKSRVDVTSEKANSLSDQTRKIVSGLQKDIRVIKFDKTDDAELRDLMTEYRNLSSRISYERIDPQERLEVAKQYSISRMGEVVVASDGRTERPAEVGEQQLTNAILKVTRERLKKVCFVEGHGEKTPSTSGGEGLSALEEGLKRENYETKTVSLAESNQAPSDCDVIVLAGPKRALLQGEAAMIGKYLDGGGKVLVMIDPDADPQLQDVLGAWNIEVGKDTVVDVSGVGQLMGQGPFVPLGLEYGSHAITKDLGRDMTVFPISRSIQSGGSGAGSVSTTDIVKTSKASWAESDELKEGQKVQLDEGKDKPGPITIGVAASKTVGENEARLVVIGDSDFASNAWVGQGANADLLLNTLNWLAQDEDLISIRPKSKTNRQVTMTASQQNFLFWLMILLMPGAVIASGVFIWLKRR